MTSIFVYAEHIGEELLSLGNTVEHSIVTNVNAVLACKFAVVKDFEHINAELKLFLAGISSCHIEAEALCLEIIIELLGVIFKRSKLFLVHFR